MRIRHYENIRVLSTVIFHQKEKLLTKKNKIMKNLPSIKHKNESCKILNKVYGVIIDFRKFPE